MGQASVCDEKRNRLIVFGGRLGQGLRGDVWILSAGRGAEWERVEPLGTRPSPRALAAAVYDRARDRMLVLFGQDSTGALGDVWELSLNGRPSWRRLDPAGTPPGPRYGHTATLDPENDRVLVYGGGPSFWQLDPGVWQLALTPRLEWSRVSIDGASPPARVYHSAVYAPDLHGMLVFGGSWQVYRWWGNVPHDSTDVWLLSTRGAARWADLTPQITGTPTCGLHAHGAVYDAAHHRMLVLPGYSLFTYPCASGYLDPQPGIWSLSLQDLAWTVIPGVGPRIRTAATAVADGAGGMWVFGGGPYTPIYGYGGGYSDTWRLDFTAEPRWSRVLPADAPPDPSRWDGQSAVYDPVRDRALLWQDGTLWGRPASGEGEWSALATDGSAPPPASGHVVVYDSNRDRLVVCGGLGAGRRYERRIWTLSLRSPMTWSLLEQVGDSLGRSQCAAIYDPIRDRMVVYGGESGVDGYPYGLNHGDVWALNLSGTPSWERIAGNRADVYWATHTLGASATYDPRRDRMIVFGGGVPDADSWDVSNDVWALSLDGTPQWQQLASATGWHPTDAPEPRALHAALYDEVGDRMLVIGGRCPGAFSRGPWQDAWALDLSTAKWSRLAPSAGSPPVWMDPLAIRDTRRHSTMVMENGLTWELEQGPGRSGGRAAGPTSSLHSEESTALALRVLRSNPGVGPVSVELSLPDAAPAQLELFDVAGRRIWSREVGSLDAGQHALAIGDDIHLRAGLYWLRLVRGHVSRTVKVVRVE